MAWRGTRACPVPGQVGFPRLVCKSGKMKAHRLRGQKCRASGGLVCSYQTERVTTWANVWLNFGCVTSAEFTPSSGEVQRQARGALKGKRAPCAQPGHCGSSPSSSCWQTLACLCHHPCPEYPRRLLAFSPSCSVDVKY